MFVGPKLSIFASWSKKEVVEIVLQAIKYCALNHMNPGVFTESWTPSRPSCFAGHSLDWRICLTYVLSRVKLCYP
jgi:hypothetical protein